MVALAMTLPSLLATHPEMQPKDNDPGVGFDIPSFLDESVKAFPPTEEARLLPLQQSNARKVRTPP
jgi:hypothetical protein